VTRSLTTPARHAVATMQGPGGAANDDWAAADDATGTYVVADGVGSARHGGWSARFVVERLPPLLVSAGDPVDPEVVAAFLRALSGDLRVRAGNRLGGIGTTVVAAVVRGATATIAHVGDSRAYLARAGRLARLTTDHALGESLVATGILDATAAAQLPGRTRLTQHIGMPDRVEPAVRTVALLPSDRLLLCSDGLTAVLDDATIGAVLASVPGADPRRCCAALLAAAAARGLVDDTTVLVIG
jgi:PPM family protein phosphatase